MSTVSHFSPKQLDLLSWWLPGSPFELLTGVIADGAIRSGKSFALCTGFMIWAMHSFDHQQFALCGKTIKSLRRNVLSWLVPQLESRALSVLDLRGDNLLVVSSGGRTNFFYLFGGRDERAQQLIQGITLAGALFDEAQLMPESFLNQASGRCSVHGSRLWFSCNPESPGHYFKREWIDKREGKRLLYRHFVMDDNPSLSAAMKARYGELYSGAFYRRYVLGEWAQAEGAVYPMFSLARHVSGDVPAMRRLFVGVDYGHTNPTVFLLMGEGWDGALWVLDEWRHSGAQGGAMSPVRYSRALGEFLRRAVGEWGGVAFEGVYVDPSAEGFIEQLREDGVFRVRKADNRVLMGVQLVSALLEAGRLKIRAGLEGVVKEFEGYAWDLNARGDKPVKKDDHAMDALRYGAMADRTYWMRKVGASV